MTLNELEKYTNMAIAAAENEDIEGVTELANIYTAELTRTFPVTRPIVPYLIIAMDGYRRILKTNYPDAMEFATAFEETIETVGIFEKL